MKNNSKKYNESNKTKPKTRRKTVLIAFIFMIFFIRTLIQTNKAGKFDLFINVNKK